MIATIVLFIGFVAQIYDPLQSMSEIFSDFMASQAGAEKVGQLLDAKVDRRQERSHREIWRYLQSEERSLRETQRRDPLRQRHLRLWQWRRSHPPAQLDIKEGTSLAIVGETGSGKTTMVNLICRFYEPTKGKIYVDGVDYLDRSLGLA
jgi:ATP-binding cassette subfamily B protein